MDVWGWLIVLIVIVLIAIFIYRKLSKTNTEDGIQAYYEEDMPEAPRTVPVSDPADALAGYEVVADQKDERTVTHVEVDASDAEVETAKPAIVNSLADLDPVGRYVTTKNQLAENADEDENVIRTVKTETNERDEFFHPSYGTPVADILNAPVSTTKPLTGAAVGKLSDAAVRDMRKAEMSIAAYAAKYIVSESTVKRVQDRKTYKDVI